MIPLWARAIFPVQSTCGWAFTLDGAPGVAHRACAKPVEPCRGGRRAAGATEPEPITDFWTTLAGPMITSSIRLEFGTVVRAPMRTFFPRLVDGSRTAFGPISDPAPIDSGP